MKMAAEEPDHGRRVGGYRTTAREEEQDTTYTKIFVGGLAWETHRDAMRRHFEQYGEILEAVVIADKITGRSKGYGFVTFRNPEAARRACLDATPIIDGRRANCNLASLGAHNRVPSPFSFMQGNYFRVMAPFMAASSQLGGSMYMGPPTYVQEGSYAFQYGYPYQIYGYPFLSEPPYHPGMYNPNAGQQYPQMYSVPTAIASLPSYPYVQFVQPGSQSFSMQPPQVTQHGVGATLTNLSQPSYALLPLSSPATSAGLSLGYTSASTVVSPGLSSPRQLCSVHAL